MRGFYLVVSAIGFWSGVLGIVCAAAAHNWPAVCGFAGGAAWAFASFVREL